MHRTRSALIGLLVSLPCSAVALDVTQCGQQIPDRTVGILQADLSCPTAGFCRSNFGGPLSDEACVESADCTDPQNECVRFAVLLGKKARLKLNGHSITGPNSGAGIDPAVRCEDASGAGGCRVDGPGTLSGFYEGIYVSAGKAKIRDVTTTGNTYGIVAFGAPRSRVQLRNVVANANVYGVVAHNLTVRDSHVSDNEEIGVYGGKTRALDLTTNGNGEVGIFTVGPARLKRLTAIDNDGPGVAALAPVVLIASAVTGNNGAGAGYDIMGSDVRLRGTTCDKSATLIADCTAPLECTFSAGPTLGLCSAD